MGFVMTIYRRRLASPFAALRQALEERGAGCGRPTPAMIGSRRKRWGMRSTPPGKSWDARR